MQKSFLLNLAKVGNNLEQFNNTIISLELADCLSGITVQGVYKVLKIHNMQPPPWGKIFS
jgi:hypothetical protein